MNVLDRLWERISRQSSPLPPAWVVAVTGLAALLVVLNTGSWRLAGKVITIAHEGGHALVSVLSGRRLEGIRLHADSSGVTYSRGRRRGPGLVPHRGRGLPDPVAARRGRGRPAGGAARDRPAVAGPGAAGRDVPGHPQRVRRAGRAGHGGRRCSRSAISPRPRCRPGFAYLAAWFLLLGGMRPVLELRQPPPPAHRGGLSDADQLARLTGVSRGVWVAVFLLVCTAALALGARLLIP